MFDCKEGEKGLRTLFLKLSNGEQELPSSSYETMWCFDDFGYRKAVKNVVEIHTFYVWAKNSDAYNLVIGD